MWLLLACVAPDTPVTLGTRGDPGEPELIPGHTGEMDEPELPDSPEDPAWIFDQELIHDIEILLSDSALKALHDEPYEYTTGDFSIDGIELTRVGVRLRGKLGSFRTMDGKPKFKFDFSEFVSGQDLSGLKSLSLNNEVVDCSYLKEPTGYAVFRALGVNAPRTGFARVTVNGEAYGLYVVSEVPDKRFLDDNYEDDSGNLYDGKYAYYDNGSYDLVDFVRGMDQFFQLEEGTDIEMEDIRAISTALAHTGDVAYAEEAEPLLDMDSIHAHWVAEQWVGHVDGYALNRNNYRVYFDPEDGRAEMIPWDLDYAFIEDYAWGYSWASPNGRMAQACWQDVECRAAHVAAVDVWTTNLDSVALGEQVAAWQTLIETDAMDDPRRECSRPSVRSEQEALATWVAGRSASVRGSWGL